MEETVLRDTRIDKEAMTCNVKSGHHLRKFLTPETRRKMGTSFRRSDFWDRLGRQALLMIGSWLLWIPSTNHNHCTQSLYPFSFTEFSKTLKLLEDRLYASNDKRCSTAGTQGNKRERLTKSKTHRICHLNCRSPCLLSSSQIFDRTLSTRFPCTES